MTTTFELQPILENDMVRLRPLAANDFDALYQVASDPLVWEQHPNKDRYKKEIFETFFKGAMESGGAFLISNINNEPIGSSRFYDLNEEESYILIGYTFFGRKWWGGNYNYATKKLMLDHAFKFVANVFFHVGAVNTRSQRSIERFGAIKIGEENIAYYGEQNNLNCIYKIDMLRWKEILNK